MPAQMVTHLGLGCFCPFGDFSVFVMVSKKTLVFSLGTKFMWLLIIVLTLELVLVLVYVN